MRHKTLIGSVLFLVTMLFIIPAGTALADSANVSLLIDGTSRDIGTGQISLEGGFSVHNGIGHYWSGATYYTVDLATETITNMGAPGSVLSNGYGDPFGMYDATTNAFYAATYSGAGDSYIYKYDYSANTWSAPYNAVNIYGGDFYNGDLYITGLREPWSGGYDTNYISLFDFSGNEYHDAIIQTGGASASTALDADGNVYYAAYTTTGSTALYRWTAAQISGVRNDLAGGDEDTFLTLAEGQKLSDLPGGANGITVDDAGHVFITTNGYPDSNLMMWNGTEGDGDNYETIAINPDGSFAWFGPLDIEGDFTTGDSLYGSYGFGGPITEIIAAPVPVPGAVWLLGSGLLGMVGLRRKAHK